MAIGNKLNEERFVIPAQAVSGNAAIDLDSLPDYVYGTAAVNPQFDERQTPRQRKAEAKRAANAKYKPGISPLAVLGCVVLAIVAAFVLLADAQLTQLNAENTALEREYDRLIQEKRDLTVKYETVFNRRTLEEYAVMELGMTKPSETQIVELPEYTEDKTVILCENLGEESLAAKTKAFLSSLLEYMA